MAWKLDIPHIKGSLINLINSIGCCDLCGGDLNQVHQSIPTLKQSLVCHNCINDLPYFDQELISANLLNWPAVSKALPGIYFDQLFALAPYIYPFEHWLAQLKYSGRFEVAGLLSVLLSTQWQTTQMHKANIDLVLSVPLHIKKWQLRGYNQAHLIAESFAQELAIPYDENLLVRSKNNESQMGKTGAQRRKNLLNNFVLHHKLPSNIKHVMLVDDVVTTGTTASEISKLLKRAGVETVTLVTVCLTLPTKKPNS